VQFVQTSEAVIALHHVLYFRVKSPGLVELTMSGGARLDLWHDAARAFLAAAIGYVGPTRPVNEKSPPAVGPGGSADMARDGAAPV
jgi:hypothetical protein